LNFLSEPHEHGSFRPVFGEDPMALAPFAFAVIPSDTRASRFLLCFAEAVLYALDFRFSFPGLFLSAAILIGPSVFVA